MLISFYIGFIRLNSFKGTEMETIPIIKLIEKYSYFCFYS